MAEFAIIDNPDNYEIMEKPFSSNDEKEFESLLEAHPEALPIGKIDPIADLAVVIGRQVTIPIGSIDLLFLDNKGRLILVECKLVKNPEARREVLSQLIEYGLYVSRNWNPQRVLSIVEEYTRKQKVKTDIMSSLHLDEKTLRKKIDEGLSSRAKGPILVLAGDVLEQRALVLSNHLNKHNFPIVCTEFRRFQIGKANLLVGSVRDATLLSTVSTSQRAALEDDEWLQTFKTEQERNVGAELLRWARELEQAKLCGVRIGSSELMIDAWGKGSQGKLVSITTERIYVYLNNLQKMVGNANKVRVFRSKIEMIVQLSKREQYPSITIKSLREDKLKQIESVIEYVLKDLKASA